MRTFDSFPYPRMRPLRRSASWLLALALAAPVLAAAQSPSYVYRIPLSEVSGSGGGAPSPGPAAEPLAISLLAQELPEATRGQPYSFDFASLLSMTGDSLPLVSELAWSLLASTLPAGFELSEYGVLSGTPTTVTDEEGVSFTVLAEHASLASQQTYTIRVGQVLLEVVQISKGDDHTCAVTPAGGAWCWGAGTYGRLGYGGTDYQAHPVQVAGLGSGVVQVSTSHEHSCAVMTDGGVKCWGRNAAGALGNGNQTQQLTPVDVVGLSGPVTQVSAGRSTTCVRTAAGAAHCWGSATASGAGTGGISPPVLSPITPAGLTSGVQHIQTRESRTCALVNSGVKCWGLNATGGVGDGSTTSRYSPTDVSGLTSGVRAIGMGRYHSCAITNAGALKCWGVNDQSQLGAGITSLYETVPRDVIGMSSGVAQVEGNWYHTCAVKTDGTLWCWGHGAHGQLGVSVQENQTVPLEVSTLGANVASVTTGSYRTCVAMKTGEAKCTNGVNLFEDVGL